MLNAKKKFGIGLTLAGMALLLLAFLSIPFAWEMRIRWLLLGGGIPLPVVAACNAPERLFRPGGGDDDPGAGAGHPVGD